MPVNETEQRDRSLTVMIPRAKYRSAPQSPQNYKSGMSTFSTEEHKLLNYLDSGTHNAGNRKQSITSTKDCKEADVQVIRTPATPTGALVSAGFQVYRRLNTFITNYIIVQRNIELSKPKSFVTIANED